MTFRSASESEPPATVELGEIPSTPTRSDGLEVSCPSCGVRFTTVIGRGRRTYCSEKCSKHGEYKRSRERRRFKRDDVPRARSEPRDYRGRRAQLRELSEQASGLFDPVTLAELETRPRRVADCPDSGPCPWVGCQYHVYLDVNPDNGTVKLNFPHLDPTELEHPCVLRLANEGGLTLEETGEHMNLTRERIRQLETTALRKLKRGGRVEP